MKLQQKQNYFKMEKDEIGKDKIKNRRLNSKQNRIEN